MGAKVSKEETIAKAAQTGSLELLQEIINKVKNEQERRESINSTNWIGTILHIAAFSGQVSIIEWILSEQGGRAAGFDRVLSSSEPDKYTALHLAAQQGHLEACKAIVNGCRVENGEREKMLNRVEETGRTVLHFAAEFDCGEIVQWLLSSEEGGGRALGFHSVLAKTTDGNTALQFANNLETFLAIVNGCRVDNGERQEMLNSPNSNGWTVLHRAAFGNQPKIVSWLLSKEEGEAAAGFDRSLITALTKNELTSALHLAVRGIDSIRALLSHCNQEERMNLFLAVDSNRWTALHYTVQYHRPDCVAELIQHPECKMIANKKDNLGMTVLHRAITGGPNSTSRLEWGYNVQPYPALIAALLGSSETGWTSIDPNVGVGLE